MAGPLQRNGFPADSAVRPQLIGRDDYHRTALYNEVLKPERLDEFALATLSAHRHTSFRSGFRGVHRATYSPQMT